MTQCCLMEFREHASHYFHYPDIFIHIPHRHSTHLTNHTLILIKNVRVKARNILTEHITSFGN